MTSSAGTIERQRLENLKVANQSITRCLSQVMVRGYLPGQVWYNLNEYPSDRHIEPDERDEKLLAEYASRGVDWVKVHEEWHDSLELYGGDRFTSYDPEGWSCFIQQVHRHRLKIVPYVSSGLLDSRSRHMHPEWLATTRQLNEVYRRNAYLSPRSPGWRSFFLKQLDLMLARDGVDGIYNDMGFYPYAETREPLLDGQVDAFADEADSYGAWEDFLGEIDDVVKSHHGTTVIHFGGVHRPPCREKHHDYLCVGEGIRGLKELRDKTRGWPPFTMVIPDWTRLEESEESVVYASCIPYLMFPILCDGRPVTGDRAFGSGIQYADDFWFQRMQRIAELRHKGASPSYGWWDAAPGRSSTKPRWYHFLKLYRLMTRDCTRAFLEITEAKFLGRPLPADVVCSAFVNEDFYLAMANYGPATANVPLGFDVEDLESGENTRMIEIAPRSLRILRKLQK